MLNMIISIGFSVEQIRFFNMLWVLIRISSPEAILMSTHNVCFYGEKISKIIPQLSPNTHLICSTGFF